MCIFLSFLAKSDNLKSFEMLFLLYFSAGVREKCLDFQIICLLLLKVPRKVAKVVSIITMINFIETVPEQSNIFIYHWFFTKNISAAFYILPKCEGIYFLEVDYQPLLMNLTRKNVASLQNSNHTISRC